MHKHKGFYASEAEGLGGNKCIYRYVLFLEWAKQRWKHCSEGGVVKIHVSLKDKKAIILQRPGQGGGGVGGIEVSCELLGQPQ